MTQGYSGGESGFIGGTRTWKPGDVTDPNAFITPSQFYKISTSTLTEDVEHKEHDVFAGPGRDIDHDHRSGKSKTMGTLTGGLYPTNKYELLVGAIGTDQLVSAIAADTTVSITSAFGISTIVLTTGDASYAYGDLVLVDTGGSQEARIIQSYDVGSKTATVGLLKRSHTSAGTAIHKVLQHKARPYTEADGTSFAGQLRRFAFEQADGTNYSYRYTDGQVMKLAIKGSASSFEAAFDVNFSAEQVLANGQDGNPDMATFSQDSSWDDLSYEFTDGFLMFPGDPTDTGTATVQRSVDAQDWDLSLENGAKEESCFDEQRAVRWFPHGRKATFTFSMLNSASRPVGWEDFVKKDKNAQMTTQMAYKAADGSIKALAICIPNLRYTKSTRINGMNTVVGEKIEATAIAVGSTPKVFFQSINDFASAV